MRQKCIKIVLSLFFVLVSYSFVIGSDYNYKVGPGDIIEISVWRDEALVRKLVVPPDGVISFPLIGDINIQGMTVEDIRNTVTEKLDAYIQDAVVTVMLLEINSMKAYVIGKVNKPGSFPILMDTTVMQMLSMAGGLNPFASEKNVHILRTVNNTTQKIPFNYREVLRGVNLKQNIILQQGDVVVVP
jgi:polysaccharide biosynthesis/export protein